MTELSGRGLETEPLCDCLHMLVFAFQKGSISSIMCSVYGGFIFAVHSVFLLLLLCCVYITCCLKVDFSLFFGKGCSLDSRFCC